MTKKNRDLVEALREMAQGARSGGDMIDDLAGEEDLDRRDAFEAMAELKGGRGSGCLADLFDDLGTDDR